MGQVVGYASIGGNGAFMFDNGTLIALPTLGGSTQAEPNSINESGTIVGVSHMKAVKWEGTTIEQLSLPIGPSSVANEINDRNQVVGWMGVHPGPPWSSQAFLWENGTAIGLDFGPGVTGTQGQAISNQGHVCGRGWIQLPGSGSYARRTYLWKSGHAIDVGTLPGCVGASGFDINDSGTIVGSIHCDENSPGQASAAFVWRNGVMRALQHVIDPVPGLTFWTPSAINNAGQIVGHGTFAHEPGASVAVILTPVPPRRGDINCDWIVNHQDLIQVIQNWGPAPPPPPPPLEYFFAPDINGDGIVNVNDLLLVINNWGS
jgi:uncharacterized membrane protein